MFRGISLPAASSPPRAARSKTAPRISSFCISDPQELSETTSQAFLGMSISCAHCHNHPLEKWTNDQYYGMANLFSRVKVKNADGEGNFTVFSTTEGELMQPRTGRPQPPCPLDGQPIAMDSTVDRRDGAGRLAHESRRIRISAAR